MHSLQVARYFPMEIRDSFFIRPLKEADASVLFQTTEENRDHLIVHLSWAAFTKTVKDSEEFIKFAIASENNATGLHCGIFQTTDNGEEKFAGVAALSTINVPMKTAQLGVWLFKEYEGIGLATQSLRKLIEYGQTIGIQRFDARTATDNPRSRALTKRLGLKQLPGEIKDAEVVNDTKVSFFVHLLDTTDNSSDMVGSVHGLKLNFFIGFLLCMIAILAVRFVGRKQENGKKNLLIVGGGYSDSFSGYLFDIARSMNIELSVADEAGHWSERMVLSRRIHSFHSLDIHGTTEKLSKEINDILTNSGIEFVGVTTTQDIYLTVVATAAKMAGLPTVGPQVYANIRDKVIIKSLIKSKIPIKRISSSDDLLNASIIVGFPAVLRPVKGEGSLAARLIYSRADLIEWYTMLKSSVNDLNLEGDTDMMLEKFVTGREYNVDIIMEKSETKFAAVTLKKIGEAPWFQQTNETLPTTFIDEKAQQNMVNFTKNACNKVGLTDGVFHVEIIMNGEEPHLVEINARLGGLLTRFNIQTVYGVDIAEFVFKTAMGMPVSGLKNRGILDYGVRGPKYITSHYVNVAFSGVISNDTFFESFSRDSRVVRTLVMANKGRKVIGPEDGVPLFLGSFMVQSEISDLDSQRIAESLLKTIDQKAIITPPTPIT